MRKDCEFGEENWHLHGLLGKPFVCPEKTAVVCFYALVVCFLSPLFADATALFSLLSWLLFFWLRFSAGCAIGSPLLRTDTSGVDSKNGAAKRLSKKKTKP